MKSVIAIVNYKQALSYISDGILPFKVGYDKKNKKIIYYFQSKKTKETWEKWKNKEYKNNDEKEKNGLESL